MFDVQVDTFMGSGLAAENDVLAKRPYIATSGRNKGKPVVVFNTGQMDNNGQPVYSERVVANATLRKDEFINLEDALIEAFRERLVIVDDLISAGLTYSVGGLGTLTSEWEDASEMTDAEITMDGETDVARDRQEFGLQRVPIPLIHKDFKIPERMLLASRTRGAGLDVTQGVEAARAVARVSESMVFNGANIGGSDGGRIYGLTNFPKRETISIGDWGDDDVTPEDIFKDILAMIKKMETEQRIYGPFDLYIPGAYASRFREDFKEFSDRTLMERVTSEDNINRVRVADKLATGNVVMVQLSRSVIDLAIASDVTTVNWSSGSGMTNYFKVFAAWAPRLKTDHDGRCGIMHATVGS
jgi:uncharacterized linocin/CFP29 family protein